ncbi:restriction endonuclease subunit S [Microbacterium paraoxydans]|uniref:Restriction endonuclease subunit S n=1 Tax=Microbacterium paraoxydans TaxID=199592 RepID=A0ABS5IIG8_9MICO|nr:restriction endonuclease subunit S [Microbacterium paraoxydans]MBS0022762.1 restriction endonuclease subunit S [Microbacterium paraoxydans]
MDLPAKKRRPGRFKVLSSGEAHGWHDEGPVKGPGFVVGRATNLGRPTWSEEDYWPLNTTLYAKNFHGNDPKFAYFWFLGTDLSAFNSGSVQPMLNRNYIANVPIDVPPVPEQQAIAATLGALDDKIESNGRAIGLIDELVRTRFNRDFSVEQSLDGTPLSSLLSINANRKLHRGAEATYVGMSALPEFSPEVLDWQTRAFGSGQKFINGDVLMARITPCLENGKTAVVDMLEDGEVGWGSTEYVVMSPSGEYSTPWIYALVRNDTVRDWAIRRMTGSSGRQRFQAVGFDEYRIETPAAEVLGAFNAFAMPLFERMTVLRDESRRLAALRNALLPELLSGRLRVSALHLA